MKPIHRLLVATDFSPCADGAAEVAAQLAATVRGSPEVVTVLDTSAVTDASGDPTWYRQRIIDLQQQAAARLRAFADRHFAGLDASHLHVVAGGVNAPDTAAELIRLARELACDLIVLGTHGKTGLDRLILGSVAEKTVRMSEIPVLTVRVPQ